MNGRPHGKRPPERMTLASWFFVGIVVSSGIAFVVLLVYLLPVP